jgi:hypothetical protein
MYSDVFIGITAIYKVSMDGKTDREVLSSTIDSEEAAKLFISEEAFNSLAEIFREEQIHIAAMYGFNDTDTKVSVEKDELGIYVVVEKFDSVIKYRRSVIRISSAKLAKINFSIKQGIIPKI